MAKTPPKTIKLLDAEGRHIILTRIQLQAAVCACRFYENLPTIHATKREVARQAGIKFQEVLDGMAKL